MQIIYFTTKSKTCPSSGENHVNSLWLFEHLPLGPVQPQIFVVVGQRSLVKMMTFDDVIELGCLDSGRVCVERISQSDGQTQNKNKFHVECLTDSTLDSDPFYIKPRVHNFFFSQLKNKLELWLISFIQLFHLKPNIYNLLNLLESIKSLTILFVKHLL